MNKNLLDRVVINYRVMGGKPIIKGTRLTVQYILKLLADGWSFTDIKTEYQGISDQDIYAGEFTMGSNDGVDNEKPVHKVYLDGYWMGKTEVTVGQYMKFVNETQSHHPQWLGKESTYNFNIGNNGPYKKLGLLLKVDFYPVVGISWDDASAYCEWLSKKLASNFKLPTEAQWEKAARGNDGRKYPWGNIPLSGRKANSADRQEWLKEKNGWADQDIDDGNAYTAPVGTYLEGVSPYGLHDMAGNAWEWCHDWYGQYNAGYQKNPAGPGSGSYRLRRGGGWDSTVWDLRCAARHDDTLSSRSSDIGFRLCQEIQ